MPKHLLTGEELSRDELLNLLDQADDLRTERQKNAGASPRKDLSGQNLITLFEKPSLRTHLSFSLAIQELGGSAVESFSAHRKEEEPEDVARVIAGYGHAIMIRTFDQSIVERMASKSPIPIINGLTDSHHPCQILADLLTLKQKFGTQNSRTDGSASEQALKGIVLTYIGDGNNILHSLLLLCPYVGVDVRYACPAGFQPDPEIVKRAKARAAEGGGSVTSFFDPKEAAQGAHALYTDVWTSMGFEEEEAAREAAFRGYQINEELYELAAPNALVMHCLPMVKGKEISEAMAEHPNSVIFRQSENRLHAQKAVLLHLLGAQ
jgi:ornithine carbamoyltransferase